MPIVIKRIKKYFPGRESIFCPTIFENDENNLGETIEQNQELLRTIKLQRNVFQLVLPESTYAQS